MHSSISTTASCGMLSISVNDLQTTAFGTWRDGAAIRCFFFGDTPTSAMAISDSQNENCNTSCTKTLHTCTFAACAGISNRLASSRSLIACNPSWTILLYLAGMFQKNSGQLQDNWYMTIQILLNMEHTGNAKHATCAFKFYKKY